MFLLKLDQGSYDMRLFGFDPNEVADVIIPIYFEIAHIL